MIMMNDANIKNNIKQIAITIATIKITFRMVRSINMIHDNVHNHNYHGNNNFDDGDEDDDNNSNDNDGSNNTDNNTLK